MKKTGRKSKNVVDTRKGGLPMVGQVVASGLGVTTNPMQKPAYKTTNPRGRNATSAQKGKVKLRKALTGGKLDKPKPKPSKPRTTTRKARRSK